MAWKQEYAERRKAKAKQDPEYRAKRNAQSSSDKEARAEYMREYRDRNPDKFKRSEEQRDRVNAARRDRYAEDADYRERAKADARKRTPEQRRSDLLKRKYRISPERYDELLQQQGYACAICRRAGQEAKVDILFVDHCHDTGAVRGLLCSACNFGIGQFEDNIDRLDRAIEYILEARAVGRLVPSK